MATDGTVFDEARLLEKLRHIEALFAGAATDGERVAAAEARARIQLRLKQTEEADPPMEYKFSVADGWSAKLFMALCRRYGIKPYRYRGQRRTTLMARSRVDSWMKRCGPSTSSCPRCCDDTSTR